MCIHLQCSVAGTLRGIQWHHSKTHRRRTRPHHLWHYVFRPIRLFGRHWRRVMTHVRHKVAGWSVVNTHNETMRIVRSAALAAFTGGVDSWVAAGRNEDLPGPTSSGCCSWSDNYVHLLFVGKDLRQEYGVAYICLEEASLILNQCEKMLEWLMAYFCKQTFSFFTRYLDTRHQSDVRWANRTRNTALWCDKPIMSYRLVSDSCSVLGLDYDGERRSIAATAPRSPQHAKQLQSPSIRQRPA